MYKILFIDDDVHLVASYKRLLDSPKYTIITATSAEQGIDILGMRTIDVIVCDYKMSGMNGVELAEYVTKNYPIIPIILLTAYADLDMAIASINRAVIYKFVQKPCYGPVLCALVEDALESRCAVTQDDVLFAEYDRDDDRVL